MKTRDLLTATEADYVQSLQAMKIKELERHANKFTLNYGNGDYNELMRATINLLQTLDSIDSERFQKVQALVRERLANSTDEDIIQRLTVLITVIITKKFNKIHAT
ncbi:hypothetical protein [Teredinibacter franksiae]|uniref:hypothetical protein n=1 Tax=Teredinibacter franksiae TaxID=2761453 RepID=UPI0016270621|nr:hypothetical protein [Teredinibacter franksiae]